MDKINGAAFAIEVADCRQIPIAIALVGITTQPEDSVFGASPSERIDHFGRSGFPEFPRSIAIIIVVGAVPKNMVAVIGEHSVIFGGALAEHRFFVSLIRRRTFIIVIVRGTVGRATSCK